MSSVCSRNREEASVATPRWARAEGGRQGWPRRLPSRSSSVKSLFVLREGRAHGENAQLHTGRMHSFIPLPEFAGSSSFEVFLSFFFFLM